MSAPAPYYLFVTGGVCSSLGKGMTASSLGALIEGMGYGVQFVKVDPYLNVDAGTMSPFEHGEVYVTEDGAETDLDLGNYERFTSATVGRASSVTTGQVYEAVIARERRGDYLGKCVQVVPHITSEIRGRIYAAATPGTDFVIIEIGGTVGDIESNPFLAAAQQVAYELGKGRTCFVHVALVPYLPSADELKTKPAQHSIQTLRSLGIQPDILLCRMSRPMPEGMRQKLSLFTQLQPSHIIPAVDVPDTVYSLPLQYHAAGLTEVLCTTLGLPLRTPVLSKWEQVVGVVRAPKQEVTIGVVGKYTNLRDAYTSVYEALTHGGFAHGAKVRLQVINSEGMTQDTVEGALKGVQGILIPGGFGVRGIEGKVVVAHHAYSAGIPFLGICLGMQVMVIAHARHVLGLAGASSTEFEAQTPHPVVDLLPEQVAIAAKGGTMRLGSYTSRVVPDSLLATLYGTTTIEERHRHRYEVNNAYCEALEESGLKVVATTAPHDLVEGVAWEGHPFGVGVQYHPEFKSKPFAPHPLFAGLVGAALARGK